MQPCIFRIDYTVEGIAREFGSVFIGQPQPSEDLALAVVEAGWAKVGVHHHEILLPVFMLSIASSVQFY